MVLIRWVVKMQKVDTAGIVKSLRELRSKSRQDSAPVGPKGLPDRRSNSDEYAGRYDNENLTDLGFNHNGVVGTGDGPVIGETTGRQ